MTNLERCRLFVLYLAGCLVPDFFGLFTTCLGMSNLKFLHLNLKEKGVLVSILVKVGLSALIALLNENVVELKARRRRIKPGWPPIRRFLVTNDLTLLNSMPGHIALNYRRPTHPPPYPVTQKNLVCAWDLMWQDYRMINCNDVNVVTVIPLKTPEDTQKFWDYFSQNLYPMTAVQKEAFMKA